jgi:Peptidase family M48
MAGVSQGMSAQPTVACPTCGADVPDVPEWVMWCVACDWNVAADQSPDPLTRRARLLRRTTARVGARTYRELLTGRSNGPQARLLRLLALALAAVVLGGLVTFAAVIAWDVVAGDDWWRWPVAALGLGLLWCLVPRPPRLPSGLLLVDRDRTPHLWNLIDRMAAELGTSSPSRLGISLELNASVQHEGWRRRSVLNIGLPLWEALGRDSRVMVLGHELGHLANRDLRRTGFVYAGRRVLTTTVSLLWPDFHDLRRRGSKMDGFNFLANAVRRALALPFLALLWSLDRLQLSARQHGEYRADLAAAAFVGADHGAASLERLLGMPGVWVRAQSAVRRGEDPWVETAQPLAPPERELRRRLRADELTGHGTDTAHPPTYLRAELVRARADSEGTLTLTDAEWNLIEAELAPIRGAATKNYRDALLTLNY